MRDSEAGVGGGVGTSSNSEAFTPVWSPLLVSLQQPFHRWHAAEAKRAGYSILFSANMIRLNGQAAAKTFLCGQSSLNNRDEPRSSRLSLRDKSSGERRSRVMFFCFALLAYDRTDGFVASVFSTWSTLTQALGSSSRDFLVLGIS